MRSGNFFTRMLRYFCLENEISSGKSYSHNTGTEGNVKVKLEDIPTDFPRFAPNYLLDMRE
jgi:hypothetical protein